MPYGSALTPAISVGTQKSSCLFVSTSSGAVRATQVALGGADIDVCQPADFNADGEVDVSELSAAADAIFAPCAPLSPEEAVSLTLSAIRVTERAALGLLSGFQFVNGAAQDAPPGSEPGACPQGGRQWRGCEILDDTFVRIPFSMELCSYLGDDTFVTADGGFSLIGTGSCPGLFVLSGSRLDLDLDVATGFSPLVDTYRIGLRGVIDEITLGSQGCSLNRIAVAFRGAIESQLAGDAQLGIDTEAGVVEANFGRQPCRPTSLEFYFDGRGGVRDSSTHPPARFAGLFEQFSFAIDVEPRQATSLDVFGSFTPGCSRTSLLVTTPERLTWRNGCAVGGALRVATDSGTFEVVFASDGNGAVDVDGDGAADADVDGCTGTVPEDCGT